MTEAIHASEFFLFDCRHLIEGTNKVVAVVFCAGQFDEKRFVERVRGHFDHRLSPDYLVLIGEPRLQEQLLAAATSDVVTRNLPSATRYLRTPAVVPVTFDALGDIKALEPARSGFVTREFGEALQSVGLTHIFKSRQGILDAGVGRHFVKPSEKHSQYFIRTGNVLLYSAEIGFIAFSLLKWLPSGTRQILTDTASINSVAYALSEMRRSISPNESVATVNSFGSYRGLDAFSAEGEADTLCLVSASTSGDLEEKVARKFRLPRDRVITLFFCGAIRPAESRVLSDLTERSPGDGGFPAIRSFVEEACPLCAHGSTRVRISGDQFLPSDPRVDSVLLTTAKLPSWITKTMPDLVGQQAISCHHRRSGTTGQIRQIHLRLADVLKGQTEFRKRFDRMMQSAVPAALRAVICLRDHSSREMGEAITQYFAAHTGKAFPVPAMIAADEFTKDPKQIAAADGAVMVVASTTVTGRSLLSVSQLLRQVVPDASIVYVIGVGRSSTKREFDDLCRNLRYGKFVDEFPLHALYSLTLADDREREGSPWAQERQLLVEIRERLAPEAGSEATVKALQDRIDQINGAEQIDSHGLKNNCFLPRWNEALGYDLVASPELRLRPGFAFWPFAYDPAKVTQADTYATISGVLHHLRTADGPAPHLVQHEHARTVLAPGNFTRFNDGVIQAALLRASRRAELDYSHDDHLSAQMRDVVQVILQHMIREEGEAGPEFLLALALGKLRLTKAHVADLRGWLKTADLPPFLRAIAGEVGEIER